MQKQLIIFLLWAFTAGRTTAQEVVTLQPDRINDLLAAASNNPARVLHMVDSLAKRKEAGYDAYLWAAEASYQLGKFYQQQHYLEKAHHIYPNDTRALPALYENYLALGNYPQALRLNELILSQPEIGKYYAKRPTLHLIHAEYGYKKSSEETFYEPLQYGQIGAGMRISSISWFHALSYLNQKAFYGTTSQYQYYSGFVIPLKGNWNIAPACHVLYVDIANSIPLPDSSMLKSTQLVLALNVAKQYKNFRLEIGVMQGNLSQEDQLQVQPTVTYYPLSDQRLFLQATGTYFTESDLTTAIVTLGGRPLKNLQVSASYLTGGTKNFIEQNGYFVNNSFDVTDNRYGVTANYNMTPTLSVYGIFQVEEKTEFFSQLGYDYKTGLLGLKKVF